MNSRSATLKPCPASRRRGATVLSEIEHLTHAILFWRSLTHWLGGMGIVVLALAILPMLGVGGMQLYRAEVARSAKRPPHTTHRADCKTALGRLCPYFRCRNAAALARWNDMV